MNEKTKTPLTLTLAFNNDHGINQNNETRYHPPGIQQIQQQRQLSSSLFPARLSSRNSRQEIMHKLTKANLLTKGTQLQIEDEDIATRATISTRSNALKKNPTPKRKSEPLLRVPSSTYSFDDLISLKKNLIELQRRRRQSANITVGSSNLALLNPTNVSTKEHHNKTPIKHFVNTDDQHDNDYSYISTMRKQVVMTNQNYDSTYIRRATITTNIPTIPFEDKQQCYDHEQNEDDDNNTDPNTLCYKEPIRQRTTNSSTNYDHELFEKNHNNSFNSLPISNDLINNYQHHYQHHYYKQQQQEQNQHHYAKDYIKLAQEYKQMKAYQNNNPKLKKQCIICKEKAETKVIPIEIHNNDQRNNGHDHRHRHRRYLSKVLFPCEHRPICNLCWDDATKTISTNDAITDKRNYNNKNYYWWMKQCPICHEEIKITFDHTINFEEIEKYWEWVHEIKPILSNGFVKSFVRFSKQSIREAMLKSIQYVGASSSNCVDVDDFGRNENDDYRHRHHDDADSMNVNTHSNTILSKPLRGSSVSSLNPKVKKRNFHNKDVVESSKTCIIQ